MTAYAELHALSNFSFRRGAAGPDELVVRARELGYRALAITDECSMAGIVRAHEAARDCGLKLVVGAEFFTACGLHLVLLAPDRTAYSEICRLITTVRRRSEKGTYRLARTDLESGLEHVLVIWKPAAGEADPGTAGWLKACFPGRLWLGAGRLLQPGEADHIEALDALGRRLDIARVAAGDVRMHRRSRRALMDVFTALRLNRPVAECGLALAANGERHLRPLAVLESLYPRAWLDETVAVAEACRFGLESLSYRYPKELAPWPLTPAEHLRRLTLEGMRRRWPGGVPEAVRVQVDRELELIGAKGFEAFFLTVHDVVGFAQSRGILCQGRGSAANSAVCYCLGITEVDPARQQLLFERFISMERDQPPDIDVDFEHERREEVLQYLYEKYGRERAALAATVICYRPKSALKDAGRALGLEPERLDRLTASLAWWDRPDSWPERLVACGFDPDARTTRQLLAITGELIGMPRHLSQHVGGMVISDAPLHHLVPVENAAMPGRTIIQWDKDDLETLGLLKVDCLALGMLTVLRKAMELVNRDSDESGLQGRDSGLGTRDSRAHPGTAALKCQVKAFGTGAPIHSIAPSVRDHSAPEAAASPESRVPSPGSPNSPKASESQPCTPGIRSPLSLQTIPREDPAVYEMLSRGDAVGVFQVESRAQMAMLPRLRPACFYDLVIEVAIVRPGPIQGDMVHPYLERRENPDRVSYPSPALEAVLKRTLGVPIFQEQVMQIAIAAAGFTPGEADRLRRAMAAWKRRGGLEPFREKLIAGMLERGYSAEFAERIFSQIRGFGEYGFPESHAASFALLTYFSAWMKRHHPAAFTCGLLNSQPMGFYAPAQLINDARRHGVRVLPVDVRFSRRDCALEVHASNPEHPAVRLGLRLIKGLKHESARAIETARAGAPFADIRDLTERAWLDRGQVRALAEAGACKALAGQRRKARWQALAARRQGDLLGATDIAEQSPRLPLPTARDELLDDYASLGLSLDRHPLQLLRPRLGRGVLSARQLAGTADGRMVETAGLVTHRQRPGTASGVIFLSLEDETGIINVIVWSQLARRYRQAVLQGRILRVTGRLQNARGTRHVVAQRIVCEDHHLTGLAAGSRDFQ